MRGSGTPNNTQHTTHNTEYSTARRQQTTHGTFHGAQCAVASGSAQWQCPPARPRTLPRMVQASTFRRSSSSTSFSVSVACANCRRSISHCALPARQSSRMRRDILFMSFLLGSFALALGFGFACFACPHPQPAGCSHVAALAAAASAWTLAALSSSEERHASAAETDAAGSSRPPVSAAATAPFAPPPPAPPRAWPSPISSQPSTSHAQAEAKAKAAAPFLPARALPPAPPRPPPCCAGPGAGGGSAAVAVPVAAAALAAAACVTACGLS
jgi:hypothetical protein